MTSKICPDCGADLFPFTIESDRGQGRAWGCPPCITEAEEAEEPPRYFVGFGDPDEFKPHEKKDPTT